MEKNKKKWMSGNYKCKSCGRCIAESLEIKGSKSFRSCKCGWIVRIKES